MTADTSQLSTVNNLYRNPIHRLHEARATSSAPHLAHMMLRDALPNPRPSLYSLAERPRVLPLSNLTLSPRTPLDPADVGSKLEVTALQGHAA